MLLSTCCFVQTAGRKGQVVLMLQHLAQLRKYQHCSWQLWALYLCCGYGREAMLSALQSGTTLVVDRYSYSGVVFTSAKQLPGLDLNWCKVCSQLTT